MKFCEEFFAAEAAPTGRIEAVEAREWPSLKFCEEFFAAEAASYK